MEVDSQGCKTRTVPGIIRQHSDKDKGIKEESAHRLAEAIGEKLESSIIQNFLPTTE